MTEKLIAVTMEEFIKNPPEEKPGLYFGYIDSCGYISIKKYSTKIRYEEIRESNNLPLFIPAFQADSGKNAKHKIKMLLIKTLENELFNKFTD